MLWNSSGRRSEGCSGIAQENLQWEVCENPADLELECDRQLLLFGMESTFQISLSCCSDVCNSDDRDEEGVLEEEHDVTHSGEEDGGDVICEEGEKASVVYDGEEGGGDVVHEEGEDSVVHDGDHEEDYIDHHGGEKKKEDNVIPLGKEEDEVMHHGKEEQKGVVVVPPGEEDVVHHGEEEEGGDVVHRGGEEEEQVLHVCLDVLH